MRGIRPFYPNNLFLAYIKSKMAMSFKFDLFLIVQTKTQILSLSAYILMTLSIQAPIQLVEEFMKAMMKEYEKTDKIFSRHSSKAIQRREILSFQKNRSILKIY